MVVKSTELADDVDVDDAIDIQVCFACVLFLFCLLAKRENRERHLIKLLVRKGYRLQAHQLLQAGWHRMWVCSTGQGWLWCCVSRVVGPL